MQVYKYTCIDIYFTTGSLLEHTLRALTVTYANDFKSSPYHWKEPIEQRLAIRVSLILRPKKHGRPHFQNALTVWSSRNVFYSTPVVRVQFAKNACKTSLSF